MSKKAKKKKPPQKKMGGTGTGIRTTSAPVSSGATSASESEKSRTELGSTLPLSGGSMGKGEGRSRTRALSRGSAGLGAIAGLDIGELMASVERVQRQLVESQQALRECRVEGSAGGGMVRISLRGDHRVAGVEISPECVDPADVGMLEDLVAAAINDALAKLEDLGAGQAQGSLSEIRSIPGLGSIPGLDSILGLASESKTPSVLDPDENRQI